MPSLYKMDFVKQILESKELKSRLFFTVLIVLIYRIGSHIPIPGVDIERLNSLFDGNGVLGFFNLFSGGSFRRFSIFALGILPYINASIITQLMVVAIPSLKELQEDGESGRKQIAQYTRYLAVALSFIQALVMTAGFREFVFPDVSSTFFLVYSVLILVAGSSFVMWLGELCTEKGIGNGASLLIFVGIVSQMPEYVKNTYILLVSGTGILNVLALISIFVLLILAVVVAQEAQRKVPIQYSKRIGSKTTSSKSFLPFRLIQGGVMPVIFASAMLQFPLLVGQLAPQAVGSFLSAYYHYDGVIYNSLFCFLIFFFSYFYAAITFNPEDISENLNKHGGFISGIRPGSETAAFLDSILSKLTLVGALLLALIAILPVLGANVTNVTSFMGLGGTAILIIVGVAMDIVKQFETFFLHRRYGDGI